MIYQVQTKLLHLTDCRVKQENQVQPALLVPEVSVELMETPVSMEVMEIQAHQEEMDHQDNRAFQYIKILC